MAERKTIIGPGRRGEAAMIFADRIPPLSPAQAERLAREEHLRFRRSLEGLSEADWARPTDCPAWNVRQVLAHVTGATEANASPVEMFRQLRHALRGRRFDVDRISEMQVAERDGLSPAELVERLRRAEGRAVRARMLQARLAGFTPLPVGEPINETWPLRYLLRLIYTRDVWMHRIDIARACDRPPALDADHDGLIVAALVREWAARHGRPFVLELTGPAGGRFGSGVHGPRYELDAIEFARILSGRERGAGLLTVPVPF